MAILGAGLGFLSGVSSWLGRSDPAKDRERYASIDGLKNEALASGLNSRPYIHLLCLAGTKTQEAIDYGFVAPNGQCRSGSDAGLAYAKLAMAEVNARLKVGGALATAGVTAVGAANTLAPGSGTSALTSAVVGSVGGIPKIVVILGIVAGAWLLLRKKR